MKQVNDDLKPQASECGPECACHTADTSNRIRWVLGIVVLVTAVAMAARAVIKDKTASTQPAAPAAFTAPVGTQTSAPGNEAAAPSVQSRKVPEAAVPAKITGSTASSVKTPPAPATERTKEPETVLGKQIGAIGELNKVAVDYDAVFVFLPGKKDGSGSIPATQVKGAAKTIETQGSKMGLFTLKTDSQDYDKISAQISVPAVLAMVKGRGMNVISGDITETKLVAGFVAASRSGGGCGSGGGGCGPSTPGCN